MTPANILFSLDGTDKVKIGDFGLVKNDNSSATTEEDGLTQKQYYTGKEFYMSPEQARTGKATNNTRWRLSTKVDIYSLGIILFELLYSFSTMSERIRVNFDKK